MKKFMLLFVMFVFSVFFAQDLLADKKSGNKIKVACIGDSITFGYGVQNREPNSYPAFLQRYLGDEYEVRNFGNSGRGILLSTMRGKEPRGYMKMKENKAALDFEPDIVICNLGINDIDDMMRGKRSEFVPDYLELLKDYQALPTKPKIFIWNKLAYLSPKHRFAQGNKAGEKYTMSIRKELNEVCQKAGVIGIDGFSALQGHPEYMPDGIHPNHEGMSVLASSIYDQILPYLNNKPHLVMPYYFANNMILPKDQVTIWGKTTPNTLVKATFLKNSAEATSDLYGRFSFVLKTGELGKKGSLTVSTAKNAKVKYSKVAVGKLYLALGQSNMEFPVTSASGRDSAIKDLKQNNRSDARVLNRVRTQSTNPVIWSQKELKKPWNVEEMMRGSWVVPQGNNIFPLSAISYYFAREMQDSLKCPVGVICIAVGGTTTESFLSENALLLNPPLNEMISNEMWYECALAPNWARERAKYNLSTFYKQKKIKDAHPIHYFQPSALFNAGLKPIQPLKFDGVLFYQGESNAPDQYKDMSEKKSLELNELLLKTLVKDLRSFFGEDSLPFYCVQLPNMNRNWMEYRLMQDKVCQELPNCHLCCILDLGHRTDVHPTNKLDVSKRLADLTKNISSPAFKNYQLNGRELMIELQNVNGTLSLTDGTKVKGIELAGEDGKYLFVDGDLMGNFIIVILPDEINTLKSVRYAYEQNPKMNLIDGLKLPLKPFKFDISN